MPICAILTFQHGLQQLMLQQAVYSSSLNKMPSRCTSKSALVRCLDERPQLSHVNPACHVP